MVMMKANRGFLGYFISSLHNDSDVMNISCKTFILKTLSIHSICILESWMDVNLI